MEFTVEQFDIIRQLAGINYTVRQVAIYFGIEVNSLFLQYQDKDSEFYQNFERGRLMASADVDMKLLNDAKGGNLSANAQYKKAAKAAQLANLKDELFGIR